jgi:hypothetical protein
MAQILLDENYAEFRQTVTWIGLRYADRRGRECVRTIAETASRLELARAIALHLRDMIRETGAVDPPAASRASNKEDVTEHALIERMQTLILVLFGHGDDTPPANKIKHDEQRVLDSIATLRTLADDYGNDDFDTIVSLLETQCGRRYAT